MSRGSGSLALLFFAALACCPLAERGTHTRTQGADEQAESRVAMNPDVIAQEDEVLEVVIEGESTRHASMQVTMQTHAIHACRNFFGGAFAHTTSPTLP